MLDGALQLILIMDFIIDWARDVYRQDVLLHLAAIAKDKPCDQVTIDGDSDIFFFTTALKYREMDTSPTKHYWRISYRC